MEQKRDKTGRFLAVFDLKNASFFAISHSRTSTYHLEQFSDNA